MNRKTNWTLLTVLFLQGFTQSFGQAADWCYLQQKPLSYFSYQKMMRDHFNYTILGTQAPVSGIKFETAKPSATIKGNIVSSKDRQLLVNLELQGGSDNDLLQLFSGNKLNGFFKASLGFNIQLSNGNNAKYVLNNAFTQMLLRKKTCEFREEIAKQVDTFLVVRGFQHMVGARDFFLENLVTWICDAAENPPYKYKNYIRVFPDNDRRSYYHKLILAIAARYSNFTLSGSDGDKYTQFIQELAEPYSRKLFSGKIASDVTRLSIFESDSIYKYHLMDDYEIATYKDVWTSKSIAWLNISTTGANSTFTLFDTTKLALAGSHVFTPALSITINYLKKWTPVNKYLYARFGITFKKSNSLIDLETFDYKKQTAIVATPSSQVTSEKSGTAYKGSLETGIGIEVPLETFIAPWSYNAMPGIYAKLQYSYGAAWINQNKIGLDLGLIWNINNTGSGATNVLTVIPYVSWTDLATEYKDPAKSQQKNLSDLFSAGIKVGIPINLGK